MQTKQIKFNHVRFGMKKQSDACIFCGDLVNLDDEGVQYKDGTCAHEDCHDGNEFDRENAADLRD